MFNVLLRAVFLFALVFITIRLMGKRQVGELQPYEFVVALMTADLATIPMSDLSIPLLWGVIGVLSLSALQLALSLIALKSVRARKWLSGTPSILIAHGVVQESVLRKQRYNLSDLMEQLRSKDVFSLADVNFAVLETNGELSVMLTAAAQNVTNASLSLPRQESELSYLLICDGHLMRDNLRQLNLKADWLEEKIRSAGFRSPKNVLLAQYVPGQSLLLQGKAPDERTCSLCTEEIKGACPAKDGQAR